MNTHVDYGEVVIEHFARTQQLFPEVLVWTTGQIEELIDAIPEKHRKLLEALKNILRREGVC